MPHKKTGNSRSRYWQEQITAWKASGQSQKGFCRAHELNYPQFVYWLCKFRRQSQATQRQRSDFVPVSLAPPEPSSELTLVLPSGLELRGIAPSNIALVQQLLGRLV